MLNNMKVYWKIHCPVLYLKIYTTKKAIKQQSKQTLQTHILYSTNKEQLQPKHVFNIYKQ